MTSNEIKVYLALLELGPSLAGRISRKTGLHRRTVYDTTEMLIQKGLLGYILENNRRLFQAENPRRIREIIDEKKEMLEPVVLELEEKYKEEKGKEETNFYKGKAGLKTVFEDQLNYPEVLIMGASPKAYETLQFYFKWYELKRRKKKIKARVIAQSRSVKFVKPVEIKYLSKKYENPVAINIYGDKVAIIQWAEKPVAVVIKSKDIAYGYRQYFELMWKVAKD